MTTFFDSSEDWSKNKIKKEKRRRDSKQVNWNRQDWKGERAVGENIFISAISGLISVGLCGGQKFLLQTSDWRLCWDWGLWGVLFSLNASSSSALLRDKRVAENEGRYKESRHSHQKKYWPRRKTAMQEPQEWRAPTNAQTRLWELPGKLDCVLRMPVEIHWLYSLVCVLFLVAGEMAFHGSPCKNRITTFSFKPTLYISTELVSVSFCVFISGCYEDGRSSMCVRSSGLQECDWSIVKRLVYVFSADCVSESVYSSWLQQRKGVSADLGGDEEQSFARCLCVSSYSVSLSCVSFFATVRMATSARISVQSFEQKRRAGEEDESIS